MRGRRIIWQAFHFLLILLVFWILFKEGLLTASSWFGTSWVPGDQTRRVLLFVTSMILFLRWGLTNFYLLKREMTWAEIIVVSVELFFIHLSYGILGGQVTDSVGMVEYIGIGFFIIGSYLNTGSEIMRLRWKKDSRHDGLIYVKGLFRYSMHINYFGDVVWATGMALISGSIWIFLIPIYMGCGFIFVHIPRLDKYLKKRYGAQYEDYAGRTKKLIPFIY
jgi:steroid 5-alpha reductase family enzyme